MNCENLAATEGFPPILGRAMSVFYAIPVHLNPRVILQIHNSLHYRILIKVWAIWNGMQTATHRNTFAGGQDRTPTAVHTHLSAVWASCCRTVPGRDLHNLLPSHGCCPARSTPVRKSVTTDMHTHARTHTHTGTPGEQHLGHGKEQSPSLPVAFHRRKISTLDVGCTSEGKWLLEWYSCCQDALGFSLCIPGHPKAVDSHLLLPSENQC